jgi:hypothetical protein
MKLNPDLSNLPEFIRYKQAGEALGVSVSRISTYVREGHLVVKGAGAHRKVTKESLLAYVSKRMQPKPKTTPEERKAKRFQRREKSKDERLYELAILFMQGARADYFTTGQINPELRPKEGDQIGSLHVYRNGQWRWA